jgi:hypothetical protein
LVITVGCVDFSGWLKFGDSVADKSGQRDPARKRASARSNGFARATILFASSLIVDSYATEQDFEVLSRSGKLFENLKLCPYSSLQEEYFAGIPIQFQGLGSARCLVISA